MKTPEEWMDESDAKSIREHKDTRLTIISKSDIRAIQEDAQIGLFTAEGANLIKVSTFCTGFEDGFNAAKEKVLHALETRDTVAGKFPSPAWLELLEAVKRRIEIYEQSPDVAASHEEIKLALAAVDKELK